MNKNDHTKSELLLSPKFAREYLERRLGCPLDILEHFPKYLMVETTNACNARCVMCGVEFEAQNHAAMEGKLFEKIASEITEHADYVEQVALHFRGEPLLDNKLPARVKRLKTGGIKKVILATNASLLTTAKGTQLLEAGLDGIHLAIDSLKKDVYEKIRRRLRFETVYENIVEFVHLRNKLNAFTKIRVQMILQQANRDEIDSFFNHWSKILSSDDEIIIQKIHNWGSKVEVMSFGDEQSVNKWPCIFLFGSLAITVKGEVALCCVDTKPSVLIGSVIDSDIKQVWSSARLKQIRQKHLQGRRREIPLCDGCTAWRDEKTIDFSTHRFG